MARRRVARCGWERCAAALAKWLIAALVVGFTASVSQAQTTYAVQGAVSTSTSQAVAGAAVVFSSGGEDVASAETSADGSYALSLAAGVYSVTVVPPSGSGFVRQTQSGVEVQANLTLDVVLVDAVPAQFAGKVVDSAGLPMSNVEVRLADGDFEFSDSTAADGTFSVAATSAATTLQLRCSQSNACSHFGANGDAYVYFPDVDLSSGSLESQQLLWQTRTLTGTVKTTSGAAVAGAAVNVGAQLGWGPENAAASGHLYASVTTGPSGTFSMRVSPGTATLSAYAPEGSSLQNVSLPITISTAAENPPNQPIVLPLAPAFSGTVVDSTGAPMQNVQVSLSEDAFEYSDLTDAQGAFLVRAHSGTLQVVLRCQAYNQCEHFGADGDGYVYLTSVDLSGGSVTGRELIWQVRTLRGTVQDEDGTPLSGVDLRLQQQLSWGAEGESYGSLLQTRKTSANGGFTLVVGPGSGTISAVPDATSGLQNESLDVTVGSEPADPAPCTITLKTAPVFAGVVVDERDRPLAGIRVQLSDEHFEYEDKTGADGSFRVTAHRDATQLQLRCDHYEECAHLGKNANAYVYLPSVDLSAGSLLDQTLVWPAHSFVGAVTDVDGVPVLGASVSWNQHVSWDAETVSGSLSAYGNTDIRGAFKFRVSPGSGTLTVVPQEETGLLPFAIDRTISGSLSLALLVQFGAEVTTEDVAADGEVTTDSEGDGATQYDPLETSLRTSTAGKVSIREEALTKDAPAGARFLTQTVHVDAPASSSEQPLELVFRLDASRVPLGYAPDAIVVHLAGDAVGACAEQHVASPDPCVAARETLSDGDLVLTVLTSAGGEWNLGVTDLGCTGNADCAQEDACIEASCVQKACRFTAKDTPECLPECALDEDCDDGEWCTTDDCLFGVCVHARSDEASCAPECDEAADCQDGVSCTVDSCSFGRCTYQVVDSSECRSSMPWPGGGEPGGQDDGRGVDEPPYADQGELPADVEPPEEQPEVGFSLCSAAGTKSSASPLSLLVALAAVSALRRRRKKGCTTQR